jgi:Domain of unknown function (DUF4268)
MGDPDLGRPSTLGAEQDLADAAAVLAVVEAGRSVIARGRPRSGPVRVVREAVWFLWERLRLPAPLVASKYPMSYPWSRLASDALSAGGGRRPAGGWGLVIEHVYPREHLVADLVDDATVSAPADVVEILSTRLIAAVLTVGEDRLLPPRSRSPRDWREYARDPWLRYRVGGLPVHEFRAAAGLQDSGVPRSRDHATSAVGRASAAALDVQEARTSRRIYARFWAQLLERLQAEHPEWALAARPNRNDLRLFSLLPGACLKCNFSRGGLRVELLLEARDALVNTRRLAVLANYLPELQVAVGDARMLRVETLDGKAQSRLATYCPGSVDEQSRWPEFQKWFIDTAGALGRAVNGVGISGVEWDS